MDLGCATGELLWVRWWPSEGCYKDIESFNFNIMYLMPTTGTEKATSEISDYLTFHTVFQSTVLSLLRIAGFLANVPYTWKPIKKQMQLQEF